jgi:hypothetical protein
MNLQKQFQAEQFNRKYLEDKDGYISYTTYSDNSLYIFEIYVRPEKRRSRLGTELEERLIKKEKPKVIYCDVDLTCNKPEEALQGILTAGYKINEVTSRNIILCKTISM